MKMILLTLAAFLVLIPAKPAQAQVVLAYYCEATTYGIGSCSDFSVATGFYSAAYAQDSAVGQCSNGGYPSASAYAFTTCGPATAVANCGASGNQLFCASYIIGIPQAGEGYYSQDCTGIPYGDGDSDGDCQDINSFLDAWDQFVLFLMTLGL